MENIVLIKIESNLNLGDTTWCLRNASEVKVTERMVVLGHGSLTLKDLDGYSLLVVLVSCESLRLLRRDNSSLRNDRSENSTHSLNSQSQRSNIDEKNALSVFISFTAEDSSLNSGAIGNSLIRVDTSVRLFAIEEVFDQ